MDLGSKRIGVAISDPLGIIAQGVMTLKRETDESDFERLRAIASEKEVGEIIVGLPLNMNGSHGPQAEGASLFADALKKKLNLPVKLWDERMSTAQVERVMIEGGASRAKRKKKIDKLAAQVILQSYLNTKTHKL